MFDIAGPPANSGSDRCTRGMGFAVREARERGGLWRVRKTIVSFHNVVNRLSSSDAILQISALHRSRSVGPRRSRGFGFLAGRPRPENPSRNLPTVFEPWLSMRSSGRLSRRRAAFGVHIQQEHAIGQEARGRDLAHLTNVVWIQAARVALVNDVRQQVAIGDDDLSRLRARAGSLRPPAERGQPCRATFRCARPIGVSRHRC